MELILYVISGIIFFIAEVLAIRNENPFGAAVSFLLIMICVLGVIYNF